MVIRGVRLPQGSTVVEDEDFGDITVTLHEAATIRGVPLRAGDRIRFQSRAWLPMIIPWWAIPIVIVLAPFLIYRAWRDSRALWVMRDGLFVFSISPDGGRGRCR